MFRVDYKNGKRTVIQFTPEKEQERIADQVKLDEAKDIIKAEKKKEASLQAEMRLLAKDSLKNKGEWV